ncbi:MAG TPA: NADH-quinone oxidoreductase subunit C [bacterium]
MSEVLIPKLKEKFSNIVLDSHSFRGDETVVIKLDALLEVCKYLRDDMGFEFLMDVTAVDYPGREKRFEVVYHFYSFINNYRLRVKVRVPESNPAVDSLMPLWSGANWFEREVYDMFGIRFSGHPDLRRILMYDEFVGYPLRKDYPLRKRQPRIPHPD